MVVREYQTAALVSIERYQGYVAQYLGDGLLVYFGYPEAHDNDAERAVRAGREIIESVAVLSKRLEREYDASLAVRIGVHTGLVVVGEMGNSTRHERLAVGDTPNIAARLQGLAEPGEIVIGAATYRLVKEGFDCTSLGTPPLKGITIPMEVFRVHGETTTRGQGEPTRLTPLVGREAEITMVLDRWRRSEAGAGQVVLIDAEPGVGKSRLVTHVKGSLQGVQHAVLECRCSPYAQNTALFPVIDLLERAFGFEREDSGDERWRKMYEVLVRLTTLPPDSAAYFGALLSLPFPPETQPPDDSAQQQRDVVLEALVAWLLEVAESQTQLFIVEDLHWADPSTLELLQLIIDRVAAARVTCLFTFRSGFTPPWAHRSYVTTITLDRLTDRETASLVLRVTGERPLPEAVVRQVLAKTDGVPLFVEEFTKALLESGQVEDRDGTYVLVGDIVTLAIPTTLQGSLTARLDRLPGAREVAQIAAVMGREFPLELLQAVAPLESSVVERELKRLEQAELVFRRGAGRTAVYSFKHALIQETAYESLLKSTRQQYHLAVARALEEHFPQMVESQPELLAHHYAEGHQYRTAITYRKMAGDSAMARSALKEAVAHFEAGLMLLPRAGAGTESLELSLQLGLGMALMSLRGFSARGVDRSFQRAFDICSEIGDVPELFPALYGLWMYDFISLDLGHALRRTEQLMAIAERSSDHLFRLEARYVRGLTLVHGGDPAGGAGLLEEALRLHDPSFRRSLPGMSAPDASCRIYLALALWLTGAAERASTVTHEALQIAESSQHPYTRAYVFDVGALLLDLRGDRAAALRWAQRSSTISKENDIGFFRAMSELFIAAADAPDIRVISLPAALQRYRAAGFHLTETHSLFRLAEAYRALGSTQEALDSVEEGLRLAHPGGERFLEAELLRLKGELMLDLGEAEDAARWLDAALGTAQRQGSHALTLRAAVSMGGQLQRVGQTAEAIDLLSSALAALPEGCDPVSRRDAEEMLAALPGPRVIQHP